MVERTALIERLKGLNSGVVSDVLDECGYPQQALSDRVRPLRPDMRLAGSAVCFGGAPASDERKALSTYDMDKRLVRGSVAVVAANGPMASAVAGGLMCLSFLNLGCAGLVTDGGVRDATEIAELGLPAFCRFVTPIRSNDRWALVEADLPVRLPGQQSDHVTIAPEDYLIGDEDGVMVIPGAIAEQVIGWAEELVRIEARIVAGLRAGEAREKVFGANPRFAHIGRLR